MSPAWWGKDHSDHFTGKKTTAGGYGAKMWQGWCLTPGLSDTRAGAFSTILCYLGGSYSNKCQDILGDVFTGCASLFRFLLQHILQWTHSFYWSLSFPGSLHLLVFMDHVLVTLQNWGQLYKIEASTVTYLHKWVSKMPPSPTVIGAVSRVGFLL